MSNILEVTGLSKRYGAFELDNVTFEVPHGYIMGFIGPNGAGKTTTIKLILGIINPDGGSVNDLSAKQSAPLYVSSGSATFGLLYTVHGSMSRQSYSSRRPDRSQATV